MSHWPFYNLQSPSLILMLYTSPAPSTAPGSHSIAHQAHPTPGTSHQAHPTAPGTSHSSPLSHPTVPSPITQFTSTNLQLFPSPILSALHPSIPTTQFQDPISWLPSHIPQHHPTSCTSSQSYPIALQVSTQQFQGPVPVSCLGPAAVPQHHPIDLQSRPIEL